MPLTDYTFKLNSTGVVLNDDSLDLPFVDIDNVIGLDSPSFRETMRDHEGVDGGFMDAEFEKGREIFLEGTVFTEIGLEETFMDSLKANYAPSKVPIPFYLKAPSVSERVIFVKPRGVSYNWDTLRRLGMSRIQFKVYAEDPRIYTNSLNSTVIPFGGPATTGFGFSFGFNLSFGATVPASGGTVIVSGNRPTPAILTISGPVVNPRVIDSTYSHTLEFQITLGASDTLVVDLANHTVLFNGTQNRRGALLAPDWFLFQPGSTFIVFGGASGTGDLLIEYRDAWR